MLQGSYVIDGDSLKTVLVVEGKESKDTLKVIKLTATELAVKDEKDMVDEMKKVVPTGEEVRPLHGSEAPRRWPRLLALFSWSFLHQGELHVVRIRMAAAFILAFGMLAVNVGQARDDKKADSNKEKLIGVWQTSQIR